MALVEDEAIRILTEELSGGFGRGRMNPVRVGIGDDAALLRSTGAGQVCTVDSCEENVHFLWEWMQPEDVAQKSFHAAISDVAAMGATPSWVVCHLTLGSRVTASWLRRFARAQAACARGAKASVVGGNVSFSKSTAVVTTAMGSVAQSAALLRSGARVGDELWLVGGVGLARAGLLLLQKHGTRARGRGAEAVALRAFREPEAQITQGRKLLSRAHSCLDVSDGLCRDCDQLARASKVRVVVSEEQLLRTLGPELREVAQSVGESPLALALEGGEDYALLATGPKERRPRFCEVIGNVQAASRGRPAGAYLVAQNSLRRLSGGFLHGNRSSRDLLRVR